MQNDMAGSMQPRLLLQDDLSATEPGCLLAAALLWCLVYNCDVISLCSLASLTSGFSSKLYYYYYDESITSTHATTTLLP